MPRHANGGRAFASARSDRLRPEDLDVAQEARQLWQGVLTADDLPHRRLVRSPLRHMVYHLTRADNRIDPIERLARLLIGAAAADYPEARLRRVPLFLNGLIDRLYAGAAHRSLADVDREERRYEAREDALTEERHLAGCTIERIDAEIEAIEREQAVSIEKIGLLRRERARLLQRPESRLH